MAINFWFQILIQLIFNFDPNPHEANAIQPTFANLAPAHFQFKPDLCEVKINFDQQLKLFQMYIGNLNADFGGPGVYY